MKKMIMSYLTMILGCTVLTLADTNIVFIHGLKSNALTWNTMIPAIAESNNYHLSRTNFIRVGVRININDDAQCLDGAENNDTSCTQLANLNQAQFRRSHTEVFGLDKGNFDIEGIDWRTSNSNENILNKSDFKDRRLFAIDFSNNAQLTFKAQGYQLKEMIDSISSITGINDFILIGHSMGGLAARAYIQNESNVKNIKKLITLNTPHLGGIQGGVYSDYGETFNAGVNLDENSSAYVRLNSNHAVGNKYSGIDVFHVGYSDDLEITTGIVGTSQNYYNEYDGNVDIHSQMGLDELDPYRVIFSPTVKNSKAYAIKQAYAISDSELKYADEVFKINDYDTPYVIGGGAHSKVLEDNTYINYISTLLPKVQIMSPINQLPTANAGSDQTVDEGKSVTFYGVGGDSDGSIVSYEWKEGTTTLLGLSSSSSISTFTKNDFTVGIHTITLTVTDDQGGESNDTVIITVNAAITTITRSDAVKLILDKFDISSSNDGFNNSRFGERINTPNDVSESTQNYDYIVTAYNRGIVNDNSFNPNDKITFEDFLTMIVKTIPIPKNNPQYQNYSGSNNEYIKAAFNANVINQASYDFSNSVSTNLANETLSKAHTYFRGPNSGISIYARWNTKYADIDLYLFSYDDDGFDFAIEKDSSKNITNMSDLERSSGIIYYGKHSADWGGNLDYDSWGGNNNQPWSGIGEERITVDSKMIRRPGKYAIIFCYFDWSESVNPSSTNIEWWGIKGGQNVNNGGSNFNTILDKGKCKHTGTLTTR